MSKTIEFFMDRPELVDKLPTEMKQKLLEAVREELVRVRGGGSWLPPSAVQAMTSVVDDKLMSQIVGDARRSNDPGWLKPEPGKPVERGTGWQPLDPIGPPPGIKYIDQMCDVQDALDKIEQTEKIAKAKGFVRRI